MKTIDLLVALGWMLTFLGGRKGTQSKEHLHRRKERQNRRRTGSDGDKYRRVNSSQTLSGGLRVSGET